MKTEKLCSIVIPVFQSRDIVSLTVNEVLEVVRENNIFTEVILVNDGSRDGSWEVIRDLAKKNKEVKSINLIKNYGQHNAVFCGFVHSNGEFIITMDDDLQNPPSEILKLINKALVTDCDLVFGKFVRKRHSLFRRLGSRFVGFLNGKIFNKPTNITLSNFRLAKRHVVDRVVSHKTVYPYIPGLLLKYAETVENVTVEHNERKIGQSNYGIIKLLSLVSRLLINYSSYPLKVLSSIAALASLLSFVIGSWFLITAMLNGVRVPGWTSIIVLLSFLGGFIIALLALIGEYLSRILNQISGDEAYYIKDKIE